MFIREQWSDIEPWLCWREVAVEKKNKEKNKKEKKCLAGNTMYKGMEKHLLVCEN